jgi:hypothetical protein
MARIKLKFVNKVHRNGRTYFYFRKPGVKRMPLPGPAGSAEFMAAYQAALDQAPENARYPAPSMPQSRHSTGATSLPRTGRLPARPTAIF